MQRLILDPVQIQPPMVHLVEHQVHYLGRVLRLGVGDRFIALDGQGAAWIVQLTAKDTGTIIEPLDRPSELPVALHLVIALPKTGFDDIVRQATELGVSRIVPILSDRTVLQPSPQKLVRWQRIITEAAEQSERQIVPTLAAPISWTAHLAECRDRPTPNHHFLGVTRLAAPHLLACPLPPPTTHHPITIAIGPEGGWTDTEIHTAIAAGYQPISLGDRILRTVTAPIVALALFAAIYEQGTVKE